MIEATCTACGKVLGTFPTPEKYTEWRNKNTECECGASLDTTLFTRYKKVEKQAEEPNRRRKIWR